MDLAAVLGALMARPTPAWPSFVCGALDASSGRVCALEARWMKFPVRDAKTAWTYCERHKPDDAELIPEGVTYAVTRLELRIVLAGRPGDLEASAV